MNSIKTSNLKIGYDKTMIVPDLNIEIEKGKITTIIGPNGCGKSTILKAIGRIIPKESGTVFINEKNINEVKTKDIAKMLSILPQVPNAPGTLTCSELVSYGRFPYQSGFGRLKKEDKKIIEWALTVTNMTKFKDRQIISLSGGERQKVWIAMALAQQTDIILLDEPTTYLDLAHQLEVLELLKYLNEKQQRTIIMVLHDLNLASRYSDHLISIKDGKVYSVGTPSEVINNNMLKDCFKVKASIENDKATNKPICISYDLLKSD